MSNTYSHNPNKPLPRSRVSQSTSAPSRSDNSMPVNKVTDGAEYEITANKKVEFAFSYFYGNSATVDIEWKCNEVNVNQLRLEAFVVKTDDDFQSRTITSRLTLNGDYINEVVGRYKVAAISKGYLSKEKRSCRFTVRRRILVQEQHPKREPRRAGISQEDGFDNKSNTGYTPEDDKSNTNTNTTQKNDGDPTVDDPTATAPETTNDENQETYFGASSEESTKTSYGDSSQGSTMATKSGHDGNVGRQLSTSGEEIKESDNKELVATVKSLEKKIADMQIDNGELLRNITSTITKSMNKDLITYRENASSALKEYMEYTNQCLEKNQGDITSSINHSISELRKRIDQPLRTSSDEIVKNINNNIGGLQLEMKNIKENLDGISQEYRTVHSQITRVQTANQNMKQELTEAIQARTAGSASSINSFTENQIESLRGDVVGLNNTFVQFINIEQQKWTNNKRELEARINKLEEEKGQFVKENHQLQTEKRTLEKSNLSNEKDIASLNRAIKKKEAEIETKIFQLRERDSVIENLKAQTQRDKNELIEKDKTIAAKNESIKEYERQRRQLKQELKESTEEANEYKEEAIGYKEKLDEANGKVSELEQKLNEPPITVLVPLPIFMDDRLQPIIRGIQEQFQTQGVKMTFFPKDPSQIQPTDVVILPSIIASRVGSDIAATFNLAQLKSNVKVLMIVFNHLAPHNANIATPTKERLNDPSISARCHSIIDMVFWQGKVLDCQVNKDAAAKISKYSRKLIARNK